MSTGDDAIVDLLKEMIEESRAKDLEILKAIEDVHNVVKDLSNDFELHTEEESYARERTTDRLDILEAASSDS